MIDERIHKRLELAFFGLLLLSIFLLGVYKTYDYDVWFHLVSGKYMVENGSIYDKEIFAYTFEGTYTENHEWLFQVIIYFIYALTGLGGVIIFKALIGSGIYAVLYSHSSMPRKNLFISIIILIITAPIVRLRIYERPEIFLYIFVVLELYILSLYKYKNKNRLFLLPIFQAIWINIHPSALLGIAIVFIFISLETTRYLLKRFLSLESPFIMRPRAMAFLAFIALTMIIASMLNPYSYKPLLTPFFFTKIEYLGEMISEMQPPNFSNLIGFYGLVLVLGFLSFLIRLKKIDVTDLIIFLSTAYLSTTALRFMPLFMIVAAPVIIRNLNGAIESAFLFDKLHKGLLYGLAFLILLSITGVFLFKEPGIIFGLGINENQFPVKAVDFVIKNDLKGNMINTYQYGGYILWRAYPERKVFIDGRGTGGTPFLDRFNASRHSEEEWKKLTDEYRIRYAIFDYSDLDELSLLSPFKNIALPADDWVLVFWDDTAMVYVKDTPENSEIIKRHGFRYIKPDNNLIYLKEYLQDKQKINAVINEVMRNIEINPNCQKAFMTLGYIYNETGQIDQAIETYLRLIKLNPYNDKAFGNLGYAYTIKGQFNNALNEYKIAASLRPKDPLHHYNLGIAYILLQMDDKAIKEINKALKMDPQMQKAYGKLEEIYIRTGRFNELERLRKDYVKQFPGTMVGLYLNRALQYYNEHSLDKALLEYQKVLEIKPDDENAMGNIGFIYYDLGNYDAAIETQKKVLELNHDFPNAHYGLALAYEKKGMKEKALGHWKRYVELEPKGHWAREARKRIADLEVR